MPKPKKELSARTLSEFTRAVKELPRVSGRQYWFRGQSSLHDWKIRPALYRKRRFRILDALYEEDFLFTEFVRLGRQLTARPQNHWEWYFLMQHFGVPTRLLDWTDNALAALHFAVGESPNGNAAPEDAVVFALDPYALNAEVFSRSHFSASGIASPDWDVAQRWLRKDRFRTQIRVRYPLAIDPPHLETRIAAQGSRFTLFGKDRDGLMRLAGELGDGLATIRISGSAVHGIGKELRTCGVSHFTLFPDLSGLGRQLELDWKKGLFE